MQIDCVQFFYIIFAVFMISLIDHDKQLDQPDRWPALFNSQRRYIGSAVCIGVWVCVWAGGVWVGEWVCG